MVLDSEPLCSRFFIAMAAVFGALGVIVGAFAAHGLKHYLTDYHLGIIETASHYQLIHCLALLGIGVLSRESNDAIWLKISGFAFILGTFLFCGSLYALALGAPRWLGPITPLGGLAFILGWIMLFIYVFRRKN